MTMTPPHEVHDADDFLFAPESIPADTSLDEAAGAPYLVLSVDDDPVFQRAIEFALEGFTYRDRPLQLLKANSVASAATVLSAHRDIATIFLDVVMETDDAGLRLVRSVRETLGYSEVRIVLVTGQPGMAPMRETIDTLDINDYWTKTELSAERVRTILVACLRDWEQVSALGRARRGLQLIVDSSSQLLYARNLQDFCERIVDELARLLEVRPEGLVCAREGTTSHSTEARIIAATGHYRDLTGHPVSAIQQPRISDMIGRCLAEREDQFCADAQVLYLPGPDNGLSCAAYLPTERSVDPTEQSLLQVFATHAHTGLVNLALVSRLDQMAYRDDLLGLPNRNALLRALTTYGDAASPPPHTLVLVDIDDFSRCNLALGFSEGDSMLRRTADHLLSLFPPPAIVARLHDDLFAVFTASDRITSNIEQTLHSGRHGVSLSAARLDLAEFAGPPADALPMASLMLKRAKQRGYGQFEVYSPGQETETVRRYGLARALNQAIVSETIEIALQPQVDLATGRTPSAEALARWPLPGGGSISPVEFVPLAEATGDIIPLGALILRKAARWVAHAAPPDFRVAVNFSVMQLLQEDIVKQIQTICAEEGARPEQIEVEVTESVTMQGGRVVLDNLQVLQQAGFTVAIDDFGTGFSSLAYLRQLPASVLKIDRCFVQEIGHVADSDAIADMVLRLAHRMRYRVVAEGIETPEQAEWLRSRACDLGQGYVYAKPLSPADMEAYLAAQDNGARDVG